MVVVKKRKSHENRLGACKFRRTTSSHEAREANLSEFWFIEINDKFGPIYRDKFDKIR